jgi:membrane fusion protein, multidrug efflux system
MENQQAPAPEESINSKNGAHKKTMIIVFVIIGIISIIVGTKWVIHRLAYTETDDAQVDADLLPISSKVPGRIVKFFVAEGDLVKAGQQIAQVDMTDYRLSLERAQAGLETARRELDKAESALTLAESRTRIGILQSMAGVDQAEGGLSISSTQKAVNLTRLRKDLERAEVNRQRVQDRQNEVRSLAEQTKLDLARNENLYLKGVVSKSQLDQARTNESAASDRLAQAQQDISDAGKMVEVARNNLRSESIDSTQVSIARQNRVKAGLSLSLSRDQREDVRVAELNIRSLQAKVKDMEAAVDQAQVALAETRIVSPVPGIIAQKVSQEFEFVSTGKPIFFIINTSDMWVTANIEETNLEHIHLGSKATVTVDAIPGKVFKGSVFTIGAASNAKFALIPESNPTGQFIKVTERVPIKIRLEGDIKELKPGINVIVSIKNK